MPEWRSQPPAQPPTYRACETGSPRLFVTPQQQAHSPETSHLRGTVGGCLGHLSRRWSLPTSPSRLPQQPSERRNPDGPAGAFETGRWPFPPGTVASNDPGLPGGIQSALLPHPVSRRSGCVITNQVSELKHHRFTTTQ